MKSIAPSARMAMKPKLNPRWIASITRNEGRGGGPEPNRFTVSSNPLTPKFKKYILPTFSREML